MDGRQAPRARAEMATMTKLYQTNVQLPPAQSLTAEQNFAQVSYNPRMSHLVHHVPRILSTESIDKGVEIHESQRCRYVLLRIVIQVVIGFRLLTKHDHTCKCSIEPT